MKRYIALLSKAPVWWGTDDKEIYDNLIFVMPSTDAEILAEKIGEPTKELEQISICKNTIFWSFDRKRYTKANWWKKIEFRRNRVGKKDGTVSKSIQ